MLGVMAKADRTDWAEIKISFGVYNEGLWDSLFNVSCFILIGHLIVLIIWLLYFV